MDESNSPRYNISPGYDISMNDRKFDLKELIKDELGELLSDFADRFREECAELGVELSMTIGVELVEADPQEAN